MRFFPIQGPPMPNRVLARKVCALAACKTLHESGELDNNLQPIGKEGFRAFESDWENFELEQEDEAIVNENTEPRPGTTKRRQYYYKRVRIFVMNSFVMGIESKISCNFRLHRLSVSVVQL